MPENNTPIFSVLDILNAYRDYDCSPEAKESILYFISDLTGASMDALIACL